MCAREHNAVYSNSVLTFEVAVNSKPPNPLTLAAMLYPQESKPHPATQGIRTNPPTLLSLAAAGMAGKPSQGFGMTPPSLLSLAALGMVGKPVTSTFLTPQPTGGLLALGQSLQSQPQARGIRELYEAVPAEDHSKKWLHVIARFEGFRANLALTAIQRADAITKFKGLLSTLNAAYQGTNSQSENGFLIGSWAKDTCIRPPRDVDMYYILPNSVYYRFEAYANGANKQSALLQEVKGKLLASYPRSVIKGDGPIVLADFNGWTVEIAPAFFLNAEDRSYYVCDTKNGGSYQTTMPAYEIEKIDAAEKRNNHNVRPLIRMLKCWQANCNVGIQSFALELLAIEFLDQWAYSCEGLFYYDWMCRDFFEWLITRSGGAVIAPGTNKIIWLGDAWKTRAESAAARAVKACDLEKGSYMLTAGDEWQKIFGTYIPRNV